MTKPIDILNVGLYITRDPRHPSDRKIRVHAQGYGTIWCYDDEDAEAAATSWIAKLRGMPEHLVNAYKVDDSTSPVR